MQIVAGFVAAEEKDGFVGAVLQWVRDGQVRVKL